MDERRLSQTGRPRSRSRSYSITPSIDTIRLEPCLPLPLHDTVLNDLIPKAKDFALSSGIAMRIVGSVNDDTLQFLPFMLLPSSFPRGEFERAKEVQKDINELIHKVAHDYEFLKLCLKGIADSDDFTGNLFRIYETVRSEGYAQPLSLGILRSDYLLDNETGSDNTADLIIKQVEINTISCSFGAITSKLNELYKFIFRDIGFVDGIEKFAESRAITELALGMIEAWKLYDNSEAGILMLVEDEVVNICDQRLLEFEIKRLVPEIRVLRRTFADLTVNRARLQPDKTFIIDTCEIALVYLRTAYAPTQIPTASDWDILLQMERSKAIKCPSMHYHLAGTKKVQQMLAQPGVVEKFFPADQEKVERIRSVFTGLYSLDMTEEGDKAVEMALVKPANFVLKPQREGGGNNLYGKDIKNFLFSCRTSIKRAGYILMDRIRTPLQKNYLIRAGHAPELIDVINELGVFGIIIGDSEKILVNKEGGHLLRTKPSSVNEGGVAAGFGAVDGVYLC